MAANVLVGKSLTAGVLPRSAVPSEGANELTLPLFSFVASMRDEAAFIALPDENEDRRSLASPFERASIA